MHLKYKTSFVGCDSVDQYMGNAEKLRNASPNICKLYTLSISHSGSNKKKLIKSSSANVIFKFN